MSEDAGIEPRTIATLALAVRRSHHSARSHPQTRLDLIKCILRMKKKRFISHILYHSLQIRHKSFYYLKVSKKWKC